MPKKLLVRTLFIASAMSILMFARVGAHSQTVFVEIDGHDWRLVRNAEHCADRVATAVRYYQDEPVYNISRPISVDRFLINHTMDCWLEVYVHGVDDVSFLFKVSQDLVITDKRTLSWWGYRVSPYPTHPHER
ncbi:MAG: hypothetical protein AAFS13_04370 [Pseudomonadota bacterium]